MRVIQEPSGLKKAMTSGVLVGYICSYHLFLPHTRPYIVHILACMINGKMTTFELRIGDNLALGSLAWGVHLYSLYVVNELDELVTGR